MASNNPTPPQPLPRQRLLEIVNGRYLSQAICLIAKLGVAKIVTPQAAVNIIDIAKQLNYHEVNLYRILSFLAAHGIFVEKEGRSFIGNEFSELMREDSPQGVYNVLMAYGSEPWLQAMVNLERALEVGNEKTPFELVNGAPFYDFIGKHADLQRNFDLAIVSQNTWHNTAPDFYDFNRYPTVMDMAGGCGLLVKAILSKCPSVQEGILFEAEAVIPNILPELLQDPYKQRFRAVTGNFLEKVDAVADLFMISMTLHCFEDSRLAKILKNIADAMRKKPTSRLLILEMDYEKQFQPNQPAPARILDLKMMIIMGGLERSYESWKTVLGRNGFKVLQKVIFPPHYCGVECELA